jgi:hypothetical protein
MFPILSGNVASATAVAGNQEGIFGFGHTTGTTTLATTNLISNTGVASSDVSGVGQDRQKTAACEYGSDKGIFGYGAAVIDASTTHLGMTNLVSNSGVVAADVTGVGTARQQLAACEFGDDKAIFGFGHNGSATVSMTNLVSNVGVVATDTSGVGTARNGPAACSYDGDKGIFGFGHTGSYASITNLVSNSGVVSSDVTGVGTVRAWLAACEYGGDKGIFGYGWTGSANSITNLVSNAGVVATDTSGVGTARGYLGACSFN